MLEHITGHTGFMGLLGSPVEHSISPMMHNEAFRQLGLDYVYLAFDVNTDNLEVAVSGLKALNIGGFNCTMPDKIRMYELCDKLSPAAKLMQSVNTVVNDNGILTGHNTDGVGYMMAVKDAGYNILGKKMTLLGAGGASTAICAQAALDGVSEIDVFNRKGPSFDKIKNIIDSINKDTSCKVSLYEMQDETSLRKSLSQSAILVNGSSVGMAPNTEECLITDTSMLHTDLIVSDVIYNPKETKLLRVAKESGCKTFNGMYMLLYQGAEAFKLWTGKEMPVDIIKAKFFT